MVAGRIRQAGGKGKVSEEALRWIQMALSRHRKSKIQDRAPVLEARTSSFKNGRKMFRNGEETLGRPEEFDAEQKSDKWCSGVCFLAQE